MIECVIVCDGYADFLAETLPYTLRQVDRLVVVTGNEDKDTVRLCKRYGVQYLSTYVHRRHSAFDKAAAINHGLAHLACSDWLLHLDADIVVPSAFRPWMATHRPDPRCIYGVDRFDCDDPELFDKLRKGGWPDTTREWGYMVHPPKGLKPCTRVGHGDYHGWVPIGFFQLWNKQSGITRYSTKPEAGGEHTDLLHAAQWEPEMRRLIPDFYVVHLSTDRKMGVNWKGRRSPPWCPYAEEIQG